MKANVGRTALVAAMIGLEGSLAIEHPLLASTDDFKETWIDKPARTDMLSELNEMRYTKFGDQNKRPVIGVLTEPLRGELYQGKDRLDADVAPGYVPRTHVQFLEQAGARVIPIDYRLSRDELVSLFSQINGLYMPGDSQVAVTDETYKGAFVIAMAYAENENFEEKEHFPVFMMGSSLATWVRSK